VRIAKAQCVYMTHSKLLFSKKEAAQMLSISLRKLENLIASKELAVRRIGRRTLIPARDLEQFARRDHLAQSPSPEGSR
jgi:excisionase family DNA binding protein